MTLSSTSLPSELPTPQETFIFDAMQNLDTVAESGFGL